MTTVLQLSSILLPLIGASFANWRYGGWLAAVAPLAALVVASVIPSAEIVTLDWVLLGIRLGVDDTGRIFLLASALMWMVAAVYAAGSLPRSPDSARFRVFFQLAMAGNFGLILAQDMVSFYLGFTLMGLSAYGLVAHKWSASARHAGRLYLRWTILGEVILFCALVLMAARSGGLNFEGLRITTPSHLTIALLVMGFGIKLALPGLHVWLPPAYSNAPSAGAAVLSGPMISAGLLGWMRFLPPGLEALSGWGQALVVIGIVQLVLGTTVGLVQRDPRAVLGYSSIAKMGVLCAGFGVALAAPQSYSTVIAVLTLYAVHHLLVKGSLFLGIGFLERGVARTATVAALVVLSLALAGAPLTSGALAKSLLNSAFPKEWSSLYWLLTASGVGSTLLMARFLYLASKINPRNVSSAAVAWSVWSLLLLLIVIAPFALNGLQASMRGWETVLLAALVAASVWIYRPQRLASAIGSIPAGDLLHLARWRGFKRLRGYTGKYLAGGDSKLSKPLRAIFPGNGDMLARMSDGISALPIRWTLAGAVWAAIFGLVYLSLAWF
jgi:formate hydrogenlyase subunit 3/multisubunit Na+/H+ antiporter MnhD subunit